MAIFDHHSHTHDYENLPNHNHTHPTPPLKEQSHRIPILDRYPWQEQVASRRVNNPPLSPRKGERYLIPSKTANGAWKPYNDYIAWYDGYNWHYDMPSAGWKVYVIEEDDTLVYNGNGWVSDSAVNVNGVSLKEIYTNVNVSSGGHGNATSPIDSISSAIDQIIAVKDNGSYHIHIAPGKYNEVITLENNYLNSLCFDGSDKEQCIISSNQKSIQSTIKNSNISSLTFKNLTFNGTVNLTGHLHNTSFGNITFDNCNFKHNIFLKNICSIRFNNCSIKKNHITIENVGYCLFDENTKFDVISNSLASEYNREIEKHHLEEFDSHNYNHGHHDHHHGHHIPETTHSSFTIITDPVGSHPAFWANKTQVEIRSDLPRPIDWKCLSNGNILCKLQNCKYGIVENEFYVPQNVDFICTNSHLYGNYHINGLLVLENSTILGHTFEHNTGKLVILGQPARQISNDSAVPGKSVRDALNHLYKHGVGSKEYYELKWDADYEDILLFFLEDDEPPHHHHHHHLDPHHDLHYHHDHEDHLHDCNQSGYLKDPHIKYDDRGRPYEERPEFRPGPKSKNFFE